MHCETGTEIDIIWVRNYVPLQTLCLSTIQITRLMKTTRNKMQSPLPSTKCPVHIPCLGDCCTANTVELHSAQSAASSKKNERRKFRKRHDLPAQHDRHLRECCDYPFQVTMQNILHQDKNLEGMIQPVTASQSAMQESSDPLSFAEHALQKWLHISRIEVLRSMIVWSTLWQATVLWQATANDCSEENITFWNEIAMCYGQSYKHLPSFHGQFPAVQCSNSCQQSFAHTSSHPWQRTSRIPHVMSS